MSNRARPEGGVGDNNVWPASLFRKRGQADGCTSARSVDLVAPHLHVDGHRRVDLDDLLLDVDVLLVDIDVGQ